MQEKPGTSFAYSKGETNEVCQSTRGVEKEKRPMKNVLKIALLIAALTACTNPVAPNQKLMGDPPIRTEPPTVASPF
jgi:hypothetical protein